MRNNLQKIIYHALRSYRLSTIRDEDGLSGYPLVDLCTPDGSSIGEGAQELHDMASEIAYQIKEAMINNMEEAPYMVLNDQNIVLRLLVARADAARTAARIYANDHGNPEKAKAVAVANEEYDRQRILLGREFE